MNVARRYLFCMILAGGVSLAVYSLVPESSYGQSHDASADTTATLRIQVQSLQQRIRALEERLQERPFETGRANMVDLSSPAQDSLDLLRDEVEALKVTLQVQQERISRIRVSGEGRIRFMNIDTAGDSVYGAHGEALEQETTFKHYMRLDTRITIFEHLTAGIKLRMTNVDRTILDEGPEYLSQEYGSAFLHYARKECNATVGAYDIFLTPLTLMRWDQEDNPEGGGEAAGGCLPCGGIAGAIPSESLEKLSPWLTFEGARINGMVGERIDVVAFYARPRYEPDFDTYRQHLVGARAKWLSYHSASSSFRHVGLTVLTTRDETSSLILKATPNQRKGQPPAGENDVVNLDFRVPLTRGFLVEGECTYSETRTDSVVGGIDSDDGYGLILGFKSQYPENLKLRCSYLRLERDFQSMYRAVSYYANRHGIRAAATLEIPPWKSSISAFGKILQEIDPTLPDSLDDDLQTYYTGSLGLSVVPVKNVLVRPSLIYRGIRRHAENPMGDLREDTFLLSGEVIFTLYKDNEFTVCYQYIDSGNDINPLLDYEAGTFFTLFSLKF